MAEKKPQNPAPMAAPAIPTEDQDVLFRAQMGVANFVLGYWRYLLIIVGAVLLVTFVYGSVTDLQANRQQSWQAAIAEVDVKVPPPDPLSQYGLAPADDPSDADKMGKLAAAAQGYEAVAKDAGGTAAAMAWLRAAETWERAGKKDEALAAYKAADAIGAAGAVGWATKSSLAEALADRGDIDGAAAIYREVANGKDFQAQSALYSLGQLYAGAGRREDAGKAFEEFTGRFADSTLADEVAAARGRLVGGGS